MNHNGYRLRPNTEASEYQKRIDKIDTVILCLAEAEKLVADLGKSLVREEILHARKRVAAKTAKRPAWEGMDCFRVQKRGYTYMVGTFSLGEKGARSSSPKARGESRSQE
ncbi:MAG: hypothetical protein ACP5M0_09790 [Desulfomonilaceae bacterium]